MSLLDALRKRNPGASLLKILWWSCVCRQLTLLMARIAWGLRWWGINNIPATGPVLLVCNHQSFGDPLVLGSGISHRHFHSMARSTLFKGLFSKLLPSINSFPVEQGNGDIKAIRSAIDRLNQGQLLLVFPEGQRTPDGRLGEFQKGIMVLIKRARPTIVPMAVEGPYDLWPHNRRFPKFNGRVGAQYGKPISAERLLSMRSEDAMDLLRSEVEKLRLDLRKKLRHATGGKFPPAGPSDVSTLDNDK